MSDSVKAFGGAPPLDETGRREHAAPEADVRVLHSNGGAKAATLTKVSVRRSWPPHLHQSERTIHDAEGSDVTRRGA
jgi:hypothetical protein